MTATINLFSKFFCLVSIFCTLCTATYTIKVHATPSFDFGIGRTLGFGLDFGINAAATGTSANPFDFEKIAAIAGFEYEPNQDIYVTKIDALQRLMGFNSVYDAMALPTAMVIDAEPIPFKYNGQTYMIELWKGQYNIMSGAEIGIYKRVAGTNHYASVGNKEMLTMSFSLYKNGVKIFDRKATHWWVTGFKAGMFSNPNELTMENIQIQF
ncbi:MAG: DUF4474 domain-containing protein, partial [Oligoflexia bacterium]|nr:DUF4474 domain-containing protein [Oligoflexia bacterium]